ncbi:hypothetical protein FNF27_05057 [Cafeteria roenbergensis]|uniref:Dynein light chain n=1 Tax=Cafeteria roenbergensis TaxID=33653 RepID=A0A5A8E9P0_CAFRO|nr:hypothetical protein FNF29_04905 [Cafeteria roenbergensis]KAA0160013.1 hypothetical protein FNF28_05593 [Cafeteria roenbergensis]KAA0173417.1 hypothetical protein FNF27_05057 [Cafeteria roenbergensis]|eukprot:KAA0151015.1 hypothetical protein FNF29_04905 [Cafeteria roenbergensis]
MAAGGAASTIMSDMDDHGKMKADARSWIKEALDHSELTSEKQQAGYVKARLDEAYGPTWHCVVGSDFKAQFTHESKTFFFVSVGKTNVLLFRTT